MSTTSSHLPVCVYCGTARPADETLCPNCGKPWIDVAVEDTPPPAAPPTEPAPATDAPVAAAAAAATAAASTGDAVPPPPLTPDDTGEFSFDDWTLPPERPKSRARWLIPILLLIAVVVVWAVVFLDGGGSSPTTVAAETTTTQATTTTEATTTTTEAATTTTEAVTTTTVAPFPPPSDWISVGDPIPTSDLTLQADAIGPLDFDSAVAFIAGRLTASLGEAEAAGLGGLCPDDEGYWLQWGELVAIFDGTEPDALFIGYRYEDTGSDTALGLATLSGLQLGDTVADLQDIYAAYTITFEVIDGQDYFRLISGGNLLLWGPVSSAEPDGVVEGIYSPATCES